MKKTESRSGHSIIWTRNRNTRYGVTEKELDRFVKRMNRRIAQERKKGTIKKYSGNLETDLAD